MPILKYLRRHPFSVEAWFEKVVALTFAFPEELLQPMVHSGLEIDGYEGLGFVTVALVWTRNMRPSHLPAFCGGSFFLAGYRIFTRFRDATQGDRRLRGLQILRSETDREVMVWLGNLFTRYHYRRVRVTMQHKAGCTRIETARPGGRLTLDVTFREPESVRLPESSPFPDWHTARRFAGPAPFTFSQEDDGSMVVIEGIRQNWTPRPVEISSWEVGLFGEAPFHTATPVLANAFAVEHIPYRWRRGRVVPPSLSAMCGKETVRA